MFPDIVEDHSSGWHVHTLGKGLGGEEQLDPTLGEVTVDHLLSSDPKLI